MSAKHTPKPWLREGCFVYALHTWKGRVANRFSAAISGYTSQGGTEAEALANARLIEAAPDLLDALEEIARLPIAGSYPDGPCLERQDMNMVRAAIAKATGKEGA
jgi:hypothetical protein